MLGLSDKEWALIQSHPFYRKIEEDSPLRNNSKFVYSTKSRAHAQAMWDNNNVTVKADPKEVDAELKAIQTPFDSTTSSTSEIPVEASVENLVTEFTEKPVTEEYQTGKEKNTEVALVEEQVKESVKECETSTLQDQEIKLAEIPVLISPINLDKIYFTLRELLSIGVMKFPFIVENLIPFESITILAGSSDVGKSTLYTQLAIAIICGDEKTLGLKIITKYKRVLIISTEDGVIAISIRILKQLKDRKVEDEALDRLMVLTTNENIPEQVEQILKEIPVDLVIIDAFGEILPGDINITTSVRKYLNNFSTIIQNYKCGVLIVHHTGKGKEKLMASKNNLLGSTGIVDKARQVLELRKSETNPNHRQLKITKGNYLSEEVKKNPFNLKFEPESTTFSLDENPESFDIEEDIKIDSDYSPKQRKARCKPGRRFDEKLLQRALELRDQGKTQDAIGKIVGKDKSTICKWFQRHDEPPYSVDRALK